MNHFRKLLLLIAPVFLSFSCAEKRDSVEFTFMTYNIYHGENYYNRGQSNINGIAEVISLYEPDFVALQEVDSMTLRTAGFNQGEKKDLVAELARLTGMYGGFAKAIDYSEGGYGEGLLTSRPSTFETVELPTPKGGEGRAMIFTTYEYARGKKITFAATHLCHQFKENRKAQTRAINDFLLGLGHPVVLAGDLNFKDDSEPYDILRAGWTDAALEFDLPRPTIPADTPRSRIDYIWLSKGHHWEINAVEVPQADHSDHLPVVARVTLKP